MKADDKKQEPILVENPQTGKYVDVRPLFEVINVIFGGQVLSLAENIDNAIKFIALNSLRDDESSRIDYQDAIFVMYEMRDAIRGMVKFKEGGE